jgi:hypothetical protein
MEREIDLTPRHLVDWLKADHARTGPRRLEVRATREFVGEDGPVTAEDLDSEDDVAVVTTVGTLEVTPVAGGAQHWVLRLRVDDPIGSHLPEDGSVPDGPEPMSLDEFEACFLATDDADATVTLKVEGAADGRAFDRVLSRILADRHAGRE